MNSRNKGKRGELELVHELRELGIQARRTNQFSGSEGTSDVLAIDYPDLHIECKRNERLVIDNAIDQASSDCKEQQTPVVMHRRNRGEWLITIRLRDIFRFSNTVRTGCD